MYSLHSPQCPSTSQKEDERGTLLHGETGSYLKSPRLYFTVCRNGGGAQELRISIWICFDLKSLNESVLCEVHLMPSVDDTALCSEVVTRKNTKAHNFNP